MSDNELVFLKENFSIDNKSVADAELDESQQHNETQELRQLSHEQLKQICRSYGRTFSNENKEKLVETVQLGQLIDQSITDAEFFLCIHSFNLSHRKTVQCIDLDH